MLLLVYSFIPLNLAH